MSQNILGLDIGGANLKAALTNGRTYSVPFPLWKHPQHLIEQLHMIFANMPARDHLAVTMTGELCDCFATKREGVHYILNAVRQSTSLPISVWTNEGRFVDISEARHIPLQVAAANWLALAAYVATWSENQPAILIDIGSTTTDIIPIVNGRPIPTGRTDPQRLHSGELVYTGIKRTPLFALLGPDNVAAELFATTQDVYLLLGDLQEDPNNNDTSDSQPATKTHSKRRIARMICADEETCTAEEIANLAKRAEHSQLALLQRAFARVVKGMSEPPQRFIISGSGEFLAKRFLDRQIGLSIDTIISFGDKCGQQASRCACAMAVASLCQTK